jgi:hypothetical protein
MTAVAQADKSDPQKGNQLPVHRWPTLSDSNTHRYSNSLNRDGYRLSQSDDDFDSNEIHKNDVLSDDDGLRK